MEPILEEAKSTSQSPRNDLKNKEDFEQYDDNYNFQVYN
jgi:hypothetical protein